MLNIDTNRNPKCPRCGYDLRGAMNLWEESCPLMGRCSECGLDFEWSYTLIPEKYKPKWCVEYSARRRSILKSSFKTYCCSLVPWYFWSRLQMYHSIRWKRLVIYWCILTLPFLLSYVTAQSAVAVIVRYKIQLRVDSYNQRFSYTIYNLKAELNSINSESPEDQKDEDIEKRKASLKKSITKQTNLQKTPVAISMSYLEVALEAVFYPFAQTTSCTIGPGYSHKNYPPPDQLYSELFVRPKNAIGIVMGSRNSIAGQWSSIRFAAMPVLINMSIGFAAYLLFPLAFVLLPASRRKAKLKWSHIFRVAVYGFSILQLVLMGSIILIIIGVTIKQLETHANNLLILVGGYGIWIGIIIWWSVAIKRYLKMPHGIVVATLLCFMIGIALAGILAVSYGIYRNWY